MQVTEKKELEKKGEIYHKNGIFFHFDENLFHLLEDHHILCFTMGISSELKCKNSKCIAFCLSFESCYCAEKFGIVKVTNLEQRVSQELDWGECFKGNRYKLLRCAVYMELFEIGFWITSGLKYGTDYVAYSTHPNLSHSMYAIKLIDEKDFGSMDEKHNCSFTSTLLSLIATSRVCLSVKKLCVLATFSRMVAATLLNLPKEDLGGLVATPFRFVTEVKNEAIASCADSSSCPDFASLSKSLPEVYYILLSLPRGT
ncbi:putative tRNA intron endonuclease, catalytic C-terminal domain [Monocercomonoides exilis]|uniref:putative tRNA intron endonuclease, catalytic C-terminal domain n=1 Tax=Monocercomonoides exilis TaxID=2049356 RepID=UPI00355A90BA|nr:putative tRNA intron endonuclease, catalytic C-terminal domain [Monocercomonoides exilis]